MTTDALSAPDSPDRAGRGRGRYRGGGAWRSRPQEVLWRVLAAEAAGAALLVLLSCVPACTDPPLGQLHRALAAGLVVALLVQCLDHISGAQLNPTVTLAAALWGRMGWRRALCMMCAQVGGATAGAAALGALLPEGAAAGGCVTVPAEGFAAWRAAALEGALGGCLALANCASWDARNVHLRDSWPLRIGTSVAAMSLVAGSLTGASMNPARSVAPALLAARWDHHWVYWVGPLGGSALCTLFYCCAWRHPAAAPATAPAALALDTHPPPHSPSRRPQRPLSAPLDSHIVNIKQHRSI